MHEKMCVRGINDYICDMKKRFIAFISSLILRYHTSSRFAYQICEWQLYTEEVKKSVKNRNEKRYYCDYSRHYANPKCTIGALVK